MKLTQHGDYLWKVTQWGAMNAYLVREVDGLTLIDTGATRKSAPYLQAAQQIGLPITRITLTHTHIDHVGALDTLCQKLPDAEIALTARSAAFLAGDFALLPGEPNVPIKATPLRETRPTHLLNPGDTLGSLRVVTSPGHSADHIAFLDGRDGTLIAGDAYQTLGGMAAAGVIRWRFPLPGLSLWHAPTALASAILLRDLNPTRLAVGHGRVLETPVAEMTKAIEELERKVYGQAARLKSGTGN